MTDTVVPAAARAVSARSRTKAPARVSSASGGCEGTDLMVTAPVRVRSSKATEALEALWADYYADPTPGGACEDALVRAFLPLVKQVSDRMYAGLPSHVDYEDVLQMGRWGLMEAVRKFDPEKASFRTYATTKIHSFILDHLRNADWLSRDKRKQVKRVQAAVQVLEQELCRTPSTVEVAGHLGMTTAEVGEALAHHVTAHVTSLDAALASSEGSGQYGYGDTLVEPEVLGPDEDFAVSEDVAMVREAIAGLPEKYRRVLCFYYYENLTLANIGEILGVTESRASQIRSRAVREMKKVLHPEVAALFAATA